MRRTLGRLPTRAAAAVILILCAAPLAPAQGASKPAPYSGAVPSDLLIKQPVTSIFPGGVPIDTGIKNPLANDPDAVQRGLRDFQRFNCVGCHAPNGGGGMGPSLSNDKWLYRATPSNIYLTIFQGRPNGMPAWGSMLPDHVIWELVSYVQSIAHPPEGFGKTISKSPQQPDVEQVPAEQITTTQPWKYTEPFRNGRRPPG